MAAYEDWGFTGLSREMIAVLNRWAAFLYGPLMDDRPRRLTEGMADGHGREMAQNVFGELRRMGGVRPPREFVFMDRAAIGLGAVFIHLRASINWHRLFEEPDRGLRRRGAGAAPAERHWRRPDYERPGTARAAEPPQRRWRRWTGWKPSLRGTGMTVFARIDHGAAARRSAWNCGRPSWCSSAIRAPARPPCGRRRRSPSTCRCGC